MHIQTWQAGDKWNKGLFIDYSSFDFVSGSQQYPGESGNTHERSGGHKGWKEGVRDCF